MTVISNTSPITNLAAVGQLPLLQQLYGNIIIPEAVYQELTSGGSEIPGATALHNFSWIQTQKVSNKILATSLEQELDLGEAEAITLAVELKASLILLDERRGYQVACRLGLKVTGVLGILIAAKSRGLIVTVKPILDNLIDDAGFWITKQLYAQILQIAAE